jgi:hypothetical protein
VNLVDISRKKVEYLKAKIDLLENILNNKNTRNLCRGVSKLKKDVQPRNNIANNKKGNVGSVSHFIFARWKTNYCRLFYVQDLMMLGSLKYGLQSHWRQSPVTMNLI